jgi:hypothetical protein
VLRITLASTPVCTAATGFLVYGFLIDADRDASTGLTGAPFADLGADARVSARCDPATGAFSSGVGPVTVTTDPASGDGILEIVTTVGNLPSISFDWIAFAQEGSRFVRLPEEPRHGTWAILELKIS